MEIGANLFELILQKERHGGTELDLIFLDIGKTSDILPLEKRLAVATLGVAEDNRAMANSGNWLACVVKLLDKLDRVLIRDEVVHRAVTTRVEEGVEFAGSTDEFLERSSLFPDRLVVVEKVDG